MLALTPYRTAFVCLLILFLLGNTIFLTTAPALMGDEASEGENVYELLQADHLVVTGERSYIGPFIDYVRVPFIALFGYTALAIRLPMLIVSVLTFLCLQAVLRKIFDEEVSLYGLTFFAFSPIYLTQQRLGWAITLLPFFAILIAFIAIRKGKHVPMLTGLASGVALSSHIMFFGTLIGVVTGLSASAIKSFKKLLSFWPAIIGFWAGFSMQFMVLVFNKEDQGDTAATTKLFSQRLHDLPDLIPQIISGSSYVASYTGKEFSPLIIQIILWAVLLLALLSLALLRRSKAIIYMWVGLLVQLLVLLYMIDRYTLRYFTVPVLWVWLLAGLGFGFLVSLLPKNLSVWKIYAAPVLGFLFLLWSVFTILIPYMRTGGSVADFSLGNRTDSASALVDIRPLLMCIQGQGYMYSDNIHIYNRLQYISHSNSSVQFASDKDKKKAQWIIRYRSAKDMSTTREGELCPALEHFRVLPYQR